MSSHDPSRRQFLQTLGLGIVSAALPWSARAAGEKAALTRPNIVFLLADQWRARSTGYAGDPNAKTPHLDRLAGESLNFSNTVSVCPVCTPYRAALLTGRYPTSTGMFLNDAYLPDEELCLAEVLQTAGYATAYIGKWHLDGHGRTSLIPPARRQGWHYWKTAECDHRYLHSHYYTGNSAEIQYWQGYDAYAQTKDAQEYLRQTAQQEKPFALMLSFGPPHFPHGTAPEELKALFPPEGIRLPPNVPEEQLAHARSESQGYYAHCAALDRCVGDIQATLEETGAADNTIVVFTSDHGEMMGSHDCNPTMKQVCWDEASHVPFLLRYPALQGKAARKIRMPLTTPDISATLLGLAGVTVPPSFEGKNQIEVVRSGREDDARAALYMAVSPFSGAATKEYRAIRTRTHTYVRNQQGPWYLFNDEADPYQMDNLVPKPEQAALVHEMDARLQAEMDRIGDKFLTAEESTKAWGYNVFPYSSVGYGPQAPVQSPKRAVPVAP